MSAVVGSPPKLARRDVIVPLVDFSEIDLRLLLAPSCASQAGDPIGFAEAAGKPPKLARRDVIVSDFD